MTNTENPITVIIADDHSLYLDGLKLLLSKQQNIKIAGLAPDGKKLIELVRELKPDVIVTDLKMPEIDGVTAIKIITDQNLCKKCIALSNFDSDHIIVEALEAGAMGYIIKNAERGEIVEAITTVYQNHPYYCSSTSLKLVRKISKSKFNPYQKFNVQVFTEKEKEIIRLICLEKTSEEISKILFMGKRNVEKLRSKILEKMKVKSIAGVAIYAMKNGLFQIEELSTQMTFN